MAQEEIALKITTEGSQTEKSVGSIRKQLREAQQDAVNLARKFGELSPEAIQAAQRVANLRDEFGDLNDRINALNPDAKFKAFSQTLQGVAGGFAGLQGAIGLFGTESAELERQLLKVQSALALSQGIDSILEARDSFKTLATLVRTNVVSAFTTLRGALIATGVGALAVGVGLLIANFEKVKQTISNLFPGLAQLATYVKGLIQDFTDFIGVTSELERQSEAFVSAKKLENEELERQIKILQAQGEQEAKVAELRKKIVQNDIDALNTKKSLSEEELKTRKDLQSELIAIDAAETKRIQDKNAQDAKLRKDKEDELKEIIKQARIENELAAFEDDQKESNRVTMKYEDLIERAKQFNLDITELEKARYREQEEIDNERNRKFIEDQAALVEERNALIAGDFDADRARLDAQRELILSSTAITQERQTQLLKENSEARQAIDDAEVEAKRQNLEIVSNLLSNFAGLAGEQTAAGKALAIASATIDTYVAAQRIFSDPAFTGRPFARFASAAAAIVAGLANVKRIASVKVPGGGGGSGQSASPQVTAVMGMQAPVSTSAPIQQTQSVGVSNVNLQNQSLVRAYVVEKDITDSQTRINQIKAAATI